MSRPVPIYLLRHFASGRHIWGTDGYGSVAAMSEATGQTSDEVWAAIQRAADLVRKHDEDTER